jgi:hypothetical protein
MGNCKSSTVAESTNNPSLARPGKTLNNSSTSALFQSVFVIAKPILRRVISQILLDDVGLLKDEAPMEKYDRDQPDESLPIQPLSVQFQNVCVLDSKSLQKDMEAMPDFEWPERDNATVLMKQHGQGVGGMLVLDLMDFDAKVQFSKGIEMVLPVKGPLGMTGNLEIGSGGDIADAWVRIHVPKLRVWFVDETQMIYVAFLGRPNLIPHLHVNADFGRGDFCNMKVTEDGSLDDVVERILSGFGPNNSNNNNSNPQEENSANPKQDTSFVGTALGALIVQAMSGLQKLGNGRPIEVPLKETIQEAIDTALHKPRPVDVIKADIERLEKELERSERANKEKENGPRPQNTTTKMPVVVVDNEVAPEDRTFCLGLLSV